VLQAELEDVRFFSANFVRTILLQWWRYDSWGLCRLQQKVEVFRKNCTMLRTDTTYKCVKHIGYWTSGRKWVALRCVLLSILDQVI